MTEIYDTILELSQDEDAIEFVRKNIEDELIELRDSHISVMSIPNTGHGLCVKERDGSDSHVIRMPTYMAIRRVFMLLSKYLKENTDK